MCDQRSTDHLFHPLFDVIVYSLTNMCLRNYPLRKYCSVTKLDSNVDFKTMGHRRIIMS